MIRINDLEFKKCSYFGIEPEYVSYEIVKWEPNTYYNKESLFKKDGNYYISDIGNFRIHKSCFKNKETCYSIAIYKYDDYENIYNIEFVDNRPLDLSDNEWITFKKLLEKGAEFLENELSH